MFFEDAFIYDGIIFLSSSLFLDTKEEVVTRTWRERLFSKPWRPLVKEKTLRYQVPMETVTVLGNKAIGHPATIAQMFGDDLKEIKSRPENVFISEELMRARSDAQQKPQGGLI